MTLLASPLVMAEIAGALSSVALKDLPYNWGLRRNINFLLILWPRQPASSIS